MKEAFDLASIRMTLRSMLDRGLLPSIECLDQPSPGFVANTRVDRRTFPGGYEGVQHRNLLRDYYSETVDKGPDPRDFQAPADTGSAVPRGDAPVHLEGADDPDLDHLSPEF